MTTRLATLACGNACERRARLSPLALSKIIAAIAIAILVMVGETWAIREAPVWVGACAVTPASARHEETAGPLRDTAGPIAVLH